MSVGILVHATPAPVLGTAAIEAPAPAAPGGVTVVSQRSCPIEITDVGDLIPFAGMAVGLVIAMTAIITGTVQRTVRSRQYEQSRREIAAYVAEGSISPDDAERLLRARRGSADDEERVHRARPRC